MQETEIVAELMVLLGCSECHARSIFIYHVDRPGPASMYADRNEEAYEEPSEVPRLVSIRWGLDV